MEKQLTDCANQLNIINQQKLIDAERVVKLEQKLSDAAQWQAKTVIAEQQAAKVQNQLSTLRTALLQLTVSTAGDVVSPKVIATQQMEVGKDDKDDKDTELVAAADIKENAMNDATTSDTTAAVATTTDTTTAAVATSTDTTTTETGPTVATATNPTTATTIDVIPTPVVVKGVDIDSRFKTRLCHFHQRGDCQRGVNCLFAHGVEELRFNPGKYHKSVSAVAAMGFDVDVAVIGALFEEYNGNTERVVAKLMHTF